MKKAVVISTILAVLLISGGIIGSIYYQQNDTDNDLITNQSYQRDEYNYTTRGNGNRGRMYNRSFIEDKDSETYDVSEQISIEELTNDIDEYIKKIDENLIIDDVFLYEDYQYYFSIIEKDTELGAFELIVDSITGNIYSCNGANIKWNEKYAIYKNGRCTNSLMSYSQLDEELSLVDANKIANEYVSDNINADYNIVTGNTFYGYYTFYIQEDAKTIGIISVNSQDGKVWLNNRHGEIIEVID
ncbi:MAG: hypothetical protein ACOWWH_07775 [Eubacteriaceae bacterium]